MTILTLSQTVRPRGKNTTKENMRRRRSSSKKKKMKEKDKRRRRNKMKPSLRLSRKLVSRFRKMLLLQRPRSLKHLQYRRIRQPPSSPQPQSHPLLQWLFPRTTTPSPLTSLILPIPARPLISKPTSGTNRARTNQPKSQLRSKKKNNSSRLTRPFSKRKRKKNNRSKKRNRKRQRNCRSKRKQQLSKRNQRR